MGMSRAARTASWWLTWLLAGALVSIFLGERVFETLTSARVIFSGLGAPLVLACLVWRIFSWRDAEGGAKRVEQILLMAYAGCLLALVLYLISSDDGMGWLGIEFEEDESRDRYKVVLQVLWPIVLAVSLLPALTAQLAIGAHRYARHVSAGLESLRVTETANGGLVVALACALLFVVCYLAVERDQSLDLSYFKTSAPGDATEAVISSLAEPLEVLLFFPAVSEVKDEALRYFRGLAGRTDRLVIHEYDRLASPQVAQEHRVFEDGTIILKKGAQSERMSIGATLQNARPALRRLDGDVQRSVLALLRERRTAYLTKGHGELNDSLSAGPLPTGVLREVTALQEFLRFLNYEVADLGLQEGLGREIPPDAALLLILGPTSRFLPEELAAVDRYLAEGGALLLALDPQTQFQLGLLEQRLGVQYRGVELADDRQHLRQRNNVSDRRLIITDRFSSHAAVTTLGRAIGSGVMFPGSGYLETGDTTLARPSYLVRSMNSTFADLNGNYELDEGEERQQYSLVAAVEAREFVAPRDTADTMATVFSQAAPLAGTETFPPSPAAGAGQNEERRMRALVFADAEMFTDAVLVSLGLNAAMVGDGLKWLGGEEAFAGATQSEEDVPIRHTQTEDVAWFYATILAAPALVLAVGLGGVLQRRRRRGRATS